MWGTGPWGGVTAGKLASQVLEVVARGGGRLESAGDVDRDADGERIAADTDQVLAEQVGGSLRPAVPRGRPGLAVTTRPWSSTAVPAAGR